MRTCQVLIERGMHLAHEAADRAMDAMQAPPPAPSIPTSSAAALADAEARARLRQPNHGLVFVQLSRSVRQSMALQAHIRAARPAPAARAYAPVEPPPTPERAATHPDRPSPLRRDAIERPDWAVRTEPDGQVQVEQILQSIRKSLGEDVDCTDDAPKQPGARTADNAASPLLPPGPSGRRPAAPEPARMWRPPIRGNPATA